MYRIALLLGLWGGGTVGHAQVRPLHGVSVVHLPATAPARPSAAGVHQYVLRPQYRASTHYLSAADTTALLVLEGPTYGLYYAGQGRTSHSPSKYQVVYWLDHDLFWVADRTDGPTQQRVLKQWLKAVGLRANDPERQRVLATVERLIKKNQTQVDSGVF
jgi:hypothetical protein